LREALHMKKTPIYLHTDLEYLVTTYNLLTNPQVIHLKKRSAKGRLAFTIKDDPIFADVLIQVTSKGKLNIYPPEDAPKEEIIEKLLKLLSDANQGLVRVLRRKKTIPRSLWSRVKHNFEQVGGFLVEMPMQGATYVGRDAVTGWREYDYAPKDSMNGIMVLNSAIELVAKARSFGVHIEGSYEGAVLTRDSLGFKDRLQWKGKLYEVRDVEEKLDAYDFAYRIGKLVGTIFDSEKKETTRACALSIVSDARNQIRTFLTTHLAEANVVRDDGSTKAVYAVIYADPPYSIMAEFRASIDPVDGLYAIGISETVPLRSADQSIYGYEENIPIFIFTIDKAGVAGTRLKERMEVELRRVCETHPIGSQPLVNLERRFDKKEQHRNITVYSTEFVLNYRHPRNER